MNGKTLFASPRLSCIAAVAVVTAAISLVPTRGFAQGASSSETAGAAPAEPTEHGMTAGVDVLGAFPVGDLRDAAGAGFGALARYELGLTSKVRVTGRVGYVYHVRKNSGRLTEIPALVGVKADFTPSFYGAAELGLFATRFSGGPTAGSTNNLGLTLGVGYRLAAFDIRAGLHALDVGDFASTMELAVSVGYNFWTWP